MQGPSPVVLNSGPEIYLEPGASVRIQGEARYFRNARISSPVRDQRLRDSFIKKLSKKDWEAIQDIQAHRNQVVNDIYFRDGLTPEQQDSLRKVAQPEGTIHDILVGYGEGILQDAVQKAVMGKVTF